MVERQELAAGAQHPAHLDDRGAVVGHAAQRQSAHRGVGTDAYQAKDLPTAPTTLRDGLALFADSPLAASALSGPVHEHLVNFARQELEAFDHESVTDWKRIRYFERI